MTKRKEQSIKNAHKQHTYPVCGACSQLIYGKVHYKHERVSTLVPGKRYVAYYQWCVREEQ